MRAALKRVVLSRAAGRCEYCLIRQSDEPFFTFHTEHITARQHGGETVEENLALACHHCNRHKGPNLTAVDPREGAILRLFHPRQQVWAEHFELRGATVVGRTATGRATVKLLEMNAPSRLQLRR